MVGLVGTKHYAVKATGLLREQRKHIYNIVRMENKRKTYYHRFCTVSKKKMIPVKISC